MAGEIGDTRIQNGRVWRLYEIELEGEKWMDIGPAPTMPANSDMTIAGCGRCRVRPAEASGLCKTCETALSLPADSDKTPEIEYEVWQDGMPVAMADSLSDAQHYMAIYGQDGPVKAMTSFTYRVDGFTAVSPLSAPSTTSTAEQPRRCSCGKPALSTASICSDCANACLAAHPGEGDAPVACPTCNGSGFQRVDDLSERSCVGCGGSGLAKDRDAKRAWISAAVSRPTPATPEGLREAVRKVGRWVQNGMEDQSSDTPSREALRRDLTTILSALQPQAQGGE